MLLKACIDFWPAGLPAGRQPLVNRDECVFLYEMDKTTLVATLVSSEKNHSKVSIKVFNKSEPIVGAVQKVLNHVIILRPAAALPITLTFADIECVTEARADETLNPISRFLRGLR